ncbi:hypothetical protein AURDEDRAFT_109553 [Auricularia subglabra TFB-10046 SS5]|nr:hypothetical protein AURDEDRAFT_109553 [Auricularia subglabra TFB-10046 SS5]
MAHAEQTPWADFGELHEYISTSRLNTIDKLKRIIDGINEDCRTIRTIAKHGKKQELIDRIVAEMSDWRAKQNTAVWLHARDVIIQVRDTGRYEPKRGPPPPIPPPMHAAGYSLAPAGYAIKTQVPNGFAYPSYASAVPPRPAPVPTAASSSVKQTIRFAPSPFFRVDQLVSGVVECQESISAMDRRSQIVSFALTQDQIAKLSTKPQRYQLRLFCTSSVFYHPARVNQAPCPIEFPPTCEVRVNGTMLNANLKGLKKKPGTAPPADLGALVRPVAVSQHKVEMIYVNSQQPVQHKKFYMVVQLVETYSVDSVIDKMRKGKYRSKEEVMSKMVQTQDEDDDIVAGPQKMSLKCPLSYVRISVPSRSIKCVHPQCFDANSWFSMMEQTTTWLCPVCEKQLNVEDMIVDGYFDSILKSTDEDVEDVMVEADGEWHTTDNKYASDGWRVKHGKASGKAPASMAAPKQATPPPAAPARRPSIAVEEIVILSSDEDEYQAPQNMRRPLAPAPIPPRASSSVAARSSVAPRASTGSSSAAVIDLTLDSDDDDTPAPPPAQSRSATAYASANGIASASAYASATGKRRERSPAEDVSAKRARPEPPRTVTPQLPATAVPAYPAYQAAQAYPQMYMPYVMAQQPAPPAAPGYPAPPAPARRASGSGGASQQWS